MSETVQMLTLLFALGWEAETGIPTWVKLNKLGIGWVADRLSKTSETAVNP